jgi:hypothetical protein
MISSRSDHFLRGVQPGRGRKIAAVIVGIIGFGIVFGVVFRGFHGRQILRDADALVQPVAPTAGPTPPLSR